VRTPSRQPIAHSLASMVNGGEGTGRGGRGTCYVAGGRWQADASATRPYLGDTVSPVFRSASARTGVPFSAPAIVMAELE